MLEKKNLLHHCVLHGFTARFVTASDTCRQITVLAMLDGHLRAPMTAVGFGKCTGAGTSHRLIGLSAAQGLRSRTAPVLARILTDSGREATLPHFVRYLERCRAQGVLDFDDSLETAETFIGLLLGDAQVRRLLGAMDAPGTAEIRRRAMLAARRFLLLYGMQFTP